MSQSNYIERVAIVGASGRVGGSFAEELVKTGKHTVTALTRAGSKKEMPAGTKRVEVDYNDEASLVGALQGQEFLIITLGVRAPEDLHGKIVAAAAKAGVPYIMPNAYGADVANRKMMQENIYGAGSLANVQQVEDAGAAWIAVVCGHWYEWSLALGDPCWGFDFDKKAVTFFDDGNTIINCSTWDQCGRAVAALLSLPVTAPADDPTKPHVEQWKNKPLYFSSFRLSQRDMLDSVHRVKGDTDADWTIVHESSAKRVADGIEEMKRGERTGFSKAMYSRNHFPNGDSDFETRYGLANDVLGLPKESLDEATKRAVDMAEGPWNPFAEMD